MTKKIVGSFFVLVFLITLTACGGKPSSNIKEESKETDYQQTTIESSKKTDEVSSSSEISASETSNVSSNSDSQTTQSEEIDFNKLDELIPGGESNINSTLMDNSGNASNNIIMTIPSSTADINKLAEDVGQVAYKYAYQTLPSAKNFTINIFANDNNEKPVYSLTAQRNDTEDPTITSETYPLLGE